MAARFLTIDFNDGTKARFSFPAPARSGAVKTIKLSAFFKDRLVIVQAQGKLNVFPFENVKAVQISTDAGELQGIQIPPHAILGASEVI
jgi:hypothetical protein